MSAPLVYGSVCSGIEAATVAWRPLGWKSAFFSEIKAFPRAVLTHHYPTVPLRGDFTQIQAGDHDPIDLLVGGTPCQSFSVAGLRGGLADKRGNLALEYLRLADRLRPNWLVWENVPGVLSSSGGRDFGAFLGGLGELGYGWAYRVLDAQHFGVPQRRRRVFVVGYLGDWRRAAAVLFERHSLSGHPAPRREAGKGFTASPGGVAGNVSSKWSKGTGGPAGDECCNLIAHSLRPEGFDASEDGTGRGTPLVPVSVALRGRDGGGMIEMGDDIANALRASQGGGDKAHVLAPLVQPYSIMPMNSGKDYKARATDIAQPLMAGGPVGGNQGGDYIVSPRAVAIPLQEVGKRTGVSTSDPRAGIGIGQETDPMFTLQAGAQHGVATTSVVRRLTPRECERLQGFTDDYTLVPYRGKPAADGPRYESIGNSMPVPVMDWIGQRIAMVNALVSVQRSAAE